MSLPGCDEKAVISRIRQLREKYAGNRGKALFANALGISPSTYNYYEQDRMPPAGVLLGISQITGADLYWLLTGQESDTAARQADSIPESLREKISTLLKSDPQATAAMNAFVDLLQQKMSVRNQSAVSQSTGPAARSKAVGTAKLSRTWLPILGRTAAGVIHFWSEGDENLPGVTELAELIGRHQQNVHNRYRASELVRDWGTAEKETVDSGAVNLVQVRDIQPDGISEFIQCPEIVRRYPDAFGLRIDGDSMAPRMADGDVVILSPSVPARTGWAAVVKLRGQIGVTCKVFRPEAEQVHLIPINENYEARIIGRDQIVWSLAVLWRLRFSL